MTRRQDIPAGSALGEAPIAVSPPPATLAVVPTTQAEKVALFGALFRGRTDVHARRWENTRTGKSGYSPHCANEWKRDVCGKPKVRCGACASRAFVPVTERVLCDHLEGKLVAGVYPLVEGDRCHFVAVDFDGAGWQEDVRAYAEAARRVGVPVALERSRSGMGAHAWFFLDAAVPAIAARQMASYVLTEAMSCRCETGMSSYDRLFPNQDTLPRGGFGNLIALPLQWEARRHGNSVFVDEAFCPFENQWEYLARCPRIPGDTVTRIVQEATRRGRVIGVPIAKECDEAARVPSFGRSGQARPSARVRATNPPPSARLTGAGGAMKRLFVACALLAFTSVAVAANPAAPAKEQKAGAAASLPPGVVEGTTARKLVAAGVKVVDVRTPAEFEAGHVPGAVNIPYDEIERRHAELGPSSTPLLVYCRTGHRSGIAIETLHKHGFQQIYDLKAYDLWVQSEPAKAKP